MATELVLLGTAAAPFPVPGRAGISSALVVDGRVFVIDCGRGSPSGFADAALDFARLEAVFLTHLHAVILSSGQPARGSDDRDWTQMGRRTITPLAGVVGGLLAGAVGTACMDAVRYRRYRRAGGTDSPLAWEFPPVESWDKAPDPGKVAKRVIEGFTQHELPDRWAWLTSTVMHWGYGSAAAAGYGIVVGSLGKRSLLYGPPFGPAVRLTGYLVLPAGGLYKPIWQYDLKTLGEDPSAHLAYGAGTGVASWLLASVL